MTENDRYVAIIEAKNRALTDISRLGNPATPVGQRLRDALDIIDQQRELVDRLTNVNQVARALYSYAEKRSALRGVDYLALAVHIVHECLQEDRPLNQDPNPDPIAPVFQGELPTSRFAGSDMNRFFSRALRPVRGRVQ